MKDKLIWLAFCLISFTLFVYFAFSPHLPLAGDIVEYFGITESFLNHQSFDLTTQDQENLEKVLHKAYFKDPTYYIKGRGERRYPVHFIFYSLLVIPFRLLLKLFSLDELNSLRVTNLFIFTLVNIIILKFFLKKTWQKIVFLLVVYFSPLIYFLSWYGVDTFYTSLLLLSIFYLSQKKYIPAVTLAAIASWHSQPLIIVPLGFLLFYLLDKKRIDSPIMGLALLSICLVSIPYIYNLFAFGVLTPWTIFQEGWTQKFGLGLQNASLKKLYELFFDLNMGLFWYAPLIVLPGFYFLFKTAKKNPGVLVLLSLMIVAAFLYQTNPAWHYGTAGFGPSRHVLFVLPFFIYFIVTQLKKGIRSYILLTLIILAQTYVLFFNGLTPKFENTLFHSPYALFVLNHKPELYNPTPEIFVDRTNHTDLKDISSAIYRYKGQCKKAYVLKGKEEKLLQTCGLQTKPILDYDKYGGAYVNF